MSTEPPISNPAITARPIYQHQLSLRVRYSETDQMGTVYNSRPLEWFECARSELFRSMGIPYASLEAKGVFLPLVEAHVEYKGRAQYDDLLILRSSLYLEGRARLRCEVRVNQAADHRPVATGHTIHAFTDRQGKAVRPPAWFVEAISARKNEALPPYGVDDLPQNGQSTPPLND